MRSRRFSFAAAVAALAAMLFAQAAFALAYCEVAQKTGAPMAHASHAMPCDEPTQESNLCFAHCSNNEQTLDKPQLKLPKPAVAPALSVLLPPAQPRLESRTFRVPVLPAGPPPRILFQSFLI